MGQGESTRAGAPTTLCLLAKESFTTIAFRSSTEA
jgi:hypothetical protein